MSKIKANKPPNAVEDAKKKVTHTTALKRMYNEENSESQFW